MPRCSRPKAKVAAPHIPLHHLLELTRFQPSANALDLLGLPDPRRPSVWTTHFLGGAIPTFWKGRRPQLARPWLASVPVCTLVTGTASRQWSQPLAQAQSHQDAFWSPGEDSGSVGSLPVSIQRVPRRILRLPAGQTTGDGKPASQKGASEADGGSGPWHRPLPTTRSCAPASGAHVPRVGQWLGTRTASWGPPDLRQRARASVSRCGAVLGQLPLCDGAHGGIRGHGPGRRNRFCWSGAKSHVSRRPPSLRPVSRKGATRVGTTSCCRPAGHAAMAVASSAMANRGTVGKKWVRDNVIGPPSPPCAEHGL